MQQEIPDEKLQITQEFLHALDSGDFDSAERHVEVLREARSLSRDHPDIQAAEILITLRRGHVTDALCRLNELGDDANPGLRTLCLYALGDPTWAGLAAELAESAPDEELRQVMQQLLEAA